jgi:hypothetical protein
MTKFYPPTSKIAQQLHRACREGDLTLVQEFIHSEESIQRLYTDFSFVSQMMIFASVNGHINICKEIWESPKLNSHVNKGVTLKNLLGRAFESGDLDTIHFFRERLAEKNINDEYLVHTGIKTATEKGHLEVIKHFFLNPPFPDFLRNEFTSNNFLNLACDIGQLEIMQFLLGTDGIKEKYNIHLNNDQLFKIANKTENMDILKYLIFDLNIPKTPGIEGYWDTTPFKDTIKMFEIRDLNKNLNAELKDTNQKNNKKLKV